MTYKDNCISTNITENIISWCDTGILNTCNRIRTNIFSSLNLENLENLFNVSPNISTINNTPTISADVFEDLTTYTEVDSASDITVNEYQTSFDTLRRDANSYVYKDFGVNNFGDFEYEFQFSLTGCDDQSNITITGISNTIDTLQVHDDVNDGLLLIHLCSPGIGLYLLDFTNGNSDSYLPGGTTIGPLYSTFKRVGTTATVEFYSDYIRTVLVDSISIVSSSTVYRYLYTVGSLNSGLNPAPAVSGSTQNFKIITP